MDNLDLQQLEMLVYLFTGLVVLTLVALVIYVVVSVRRGATTALYDADHLLVRPSLLVAGQILALVREAQGAPIQVEIEGTRYRSLAEVEDPQMKRQIVDAAQELIQFTGVLGDVDLRLVSIGETDSWREDLREGSQAELERAHGAPADRQALVQPVPAPDEVEERFLSLLSEMGQTTSAEKPTLASAIQRGIKPKPLESGSARTFVDDIEDIVQRRILLIPALTGRGLHIQPAPSGKVVFTFEGKVHESVDKIPNLTAREVIKDAIQEWEDTA